MLTTRASKRNIIRNIIHIDAYSAAGYPGDISDLLFIHRANRESRCVAAAAPSCVKFTEKSP